MDKKKKNGSTNEKKKCGAHLQCAKHCSKHFMHIMSCSYHNCSVSEVGETFEDTQVERGQVTSAGHKMRNNNVILYSSHTTKTALLYHLRQEGKCQKTL